VFGSRQFKSPRFHAALISYTIAQLLSSDSTADRFVADKLSLSDWQHFALFVSLLTGAEIAIDSSKIVSFECLWACIGQTPFMGR
jgi:hypothetical protein